MDTPLRFDSTATCMPLERFAYILAVVDPFTVVRDIQKGLATKASVFPDKHTHEFSADLAVYLANIAPSPVWAANFWAVAITAFPKFESPATAIASVLHTVWRVLVARASVSFIIRACAAVKSSVFLATVPHDTARACQFTTYNFAVWSLLYTTYPIEFLATLDANIAAAKDIIPSYHLVVKTVDTAAKFYADPSTPTTTLFYYSPFPESWAAVAPLGLMIYALFNQTPQKYPALIHTPLFPSHAALGPRLVAPLEDPEIADNLSALYIGFIASKCPTAAAAAIAPLVFRACARTNRWRTFHAYQAAVSYQTYLATVESKVAATDKSISYSKIAASPFIQAIFFAWSDPPHAHQYITCGIKRMHAENASQAAISQFLQLYPSVATVADRKRAPSVSSTGSESSSSGEEDDSDSDSSPVDSTDSDSSSSTTNRKKPTKKLKNLDPVDVSSADEAPDPKQKPATTQDSFYPEDDVLCYSHDEEP
jgi:hypothetical protein